MPGFSRAPESILSDMARSPLSCGPGARSASGGRHARRAANADSSESPREIPVQPLQVHRLLGARWRRHSAATAVTRARERQRPAVLEGAWLAFVNDVGALFSRSPAIDRVLSRGAGATKRRWLLGSEAVGFSDQGMTETSNIRGASSSSVVRLLMRLSLLLTARVICTRSDVLGS